MLQYSGHSANIKEVRAAAGLFLIWATGDSEASASVRWTKRWITRLATWLKSIRGKPLSTKRLAAHIVEDVRGHFQEFDRVMKRYNVRIVDVSNFDESGFQNGVVTGDFILSVPILRLFIVRIQVIGSLLQRLQTLIMVERGFLR